MHFIGLVGMGACIGQEVAIRAAGPRAQHGQYGRVGQADAFLADQLELFRDIHRDCGFFMFQKHVCVMSFLPEFYNANRERLLGPEGPWSELNGRYEAHARLVAACLQHDTLERLEPHPGVHRLSFTPARIWSPARARRCPSSMASRAPRAC